MKRVDCLEICSPFDTVEVFIDLCQSAGGSGGVPA